MNAAKNRELIQRMLAPLAEGETRPFVEGLADDVVWTVTGKNPWAGAYRGKTALRRDLFGRVLPHFKQPYRLKIERIAAEGETVFVELRGVGNETADGVRYEQEYCWSCRVADGQIKEVREYADTFLFMSVMAAGGAATAT